MSTITKPPKIKSVPLDKLKRDRRKYSTLPISAKNKEVKGFKDIHPQIKMTELQATVLERYTEDGHCEINEALRDHSGFGMRMDHDDDYDYDDDDDGYYDSSGLWRKYKRKKRKPITLADYILAMDRLLKKARINKSVSVYRGFYGSEEVLGKLRVGSLFQDRGFLSTSILPNICLSFTESCDVDEDDDSYRVIHLIKIDVPKGSNAIQGCGGEYELILPRGQQFRVIKIDTIKGKHPYGYLGDYRFKVYHMKPVNGRAIKVLR